jgi:hypothetical protein
MSNFFDCRRIEQLNRTKKNSIMVQQNPWRVDHIRSRCCCCCANSLSSWDFSASSYDHKDSPAAVDLLQSHCNTEKKSNKCLLNSFIPLLPLLNLDNSSYNKYHQSPRTLMQYSSLQLWSILLVSVQQLHTPLTTRTWEPATQNTSLSGDSGLSGLFVFRSVLCGRCFSGACDHVY